MSPTRTTGDSRDSVWGSEQERGPPTSQIKDTPSTEQGSPGRPDPQCRLRISVLGPSRAGAPGHSEAAPVQNHRPRAEGGSASSGLSLDVNTCARACTRVCARLHMCHRVCSHTTQHRWRLRLHPGSARLARVVQAARLASSFLPALAAVWRSVIASNAFVKSYRPRSSTYAQSIN